MLISKFKRQEPGRAIFVWDGSLQSVREAEVILNSLGRHLVRAVYAMPHESFESYCTVNHPDQEPTKQELQLRASFAAAVRDTQPLKDAKFEVVFGDRISAIARIAGLTRAKFILASSFEQSSFSKWIHGDLNQRLVKKSPCPVIFLGSASLEIPKTKSSLKK